jgi:hypothetical protein
MSRRGIYGLALGAFALGAVIGGVVGIFGFLQLIGGSGEPSATISAPTLSLADSHPKATTPPLDTAQMATGVAQIAAQIAALPTISSENASLGTRVAGIEADGGADRPRQVGGRLRPIPVALNRPTDLRPRLIRPRQRQL